MQALDLHLPPGDLESRFSVAHDLVIRRELGVGGASIETVMALALFLACQICPAPADVASEADRLELLHRAARVTEDEAYALLTSVTAIVGQRLGHL